MGFFVDEKTLESVTERKTIARRPLTKASQQLTSERGCDVCPRKHLWGTLATPRMPTFGPSDTRVMILGSAPSIDDDRAGKPFQDEEGKLLRSALPARARDDVCFQNLVRCASREKPTAQEIHACSIYLEAEIDERKILFIVGVGHAPLSRFIPETNTGKIHGTAFPVTIGDRTRWFYSVLDPEFVSRMGSEKGAAFPVLRADLKRFFDDYKQYPRPVISHFDPQAVIWAKSAQEVRDIVDSWKDPIAVDLETTALKPFCDGRVLACAFASINGAVAFSVDHPEERNNWAWPLILDIITKRRWIAHNSGFELLWFWYSLGLSWKPTDFEDTMAIARVLHERETLLGLSIMSRIHLGVDIKAITKVDASRMQDYSLKEIIPYVGLDAQASACLFALLHRNVNPTYYDRLIDTQISIVGMELYGLPIDIEETRQLHATLTKRKIEVERNAKDLYEVKEWSRRTQREFNIGSSEHVGSVLAEIVRVPLPKTAKQYKTDDETLAQFVASSPLVLFTQEYREVSKLLGTYIDPNLSGEYQGLDGNIHPSYDAMRVATLRLSSANPNIQNYPKRKHREVRKQVKAPAGQVIVAIDFGQLQGRIAGMLSGDRHFIQLMIDGYDIHGHWRDRLLDRYPDFMIRIRDKSGETDDTKLLKAGRNLIKQDFVFHSLFGGTARGAAERTGVPENIMIDLQREFWTTFPVVYQWIKNKRNEYRDTGGVTLASGLRRHAVMMGNEPINNPIQNGEAEIVMGAQAELFARSFATGDLFWRPRLNVHDDLSFFLPDNDAALDDYIPKIADIMLRPRFKWIICPLVVEVSVGYNWADLEEVAVFTGPYHR